MIELNTPIIKLNRVGAAAAKRLEKIGVNFVIDLLNYFPFRYDDFSKITSIKNLKPNTSANITGQIELIQNKRSPRKRINITEAIVSDSTEQIKIIWFNQPFIARNLRAGDKISLAGKVEHGPAGLQMTSPIYEKLISGNTIHTQGLVPIYHLTANITEKQIRFLIKQILLLADELEDWLPEATIKRQKLLPLNKAIKNIHFPKNFKDINNARGRLGFNELFLLQLQSELIKKELESFRAIKIKFFENETKKFVESLPFSLTPAQKKAAWEIIKDLEKSKPMARLLEGDVGCGKTIVALIAMLNTALNKRQAAIMVPTEILAVQHYNSITKLLQNQKIKIGLMTRAEKKINYDLKIQKINAKQIADNSNIIIGTHALIQEKINFKNLALVIIDEQHRFGVEQRKTLIDKSEKKNLLPHLLSMTATPIPRSLALALFGDLSITIINEMPKGRKKINTFVIPEKKRSDAYNFIRKQINKGRQIYVVCPLIDISDKLGVKSVKEEFEKLNNTIFPDLSIAMLHGRLKTTEKEKIMKDFLDNKINILVSTSVIEVGIDIPNASIMMIEGADRFGLAQLHQFRGRVGRSRHQSYCFLLTDNESQKTLNRLNALVKYHNGFDLAKIDLKFRGPGEVYGTAQKGFPELKIASLFDYELIKQAQSEAKELMNIDPKLINHPSLVQKLGEWEKKTHLE
ncbi:DNA helicase RecG [Candidatus Falkowbacteria bacterium]|nr:MAG: DNA helicase RecG [Candidatus Falkowbacteria bacterium]